MEDERVFLRRRVAASWILYFLGAVTVIGLIFTSIFPLVWRRLAYDTRYESHFVVQLWTAPIIVLLGMAVVIVPIQAFQFGLGIPLLALVTFLTIKGLLRLRQDREFPRLRRLLSFRAHSTSG